MTAAWNIARRELSAGLNGFWIYLACIFLGVATIAAAGSVTKVFTRGLAGEARMLLGGDAMFTVSQRRADAEERAFVEGLGTVTEKVSLNVMGQAGGDRRQVDITAVDGKFPLIGTVDLSGTDKSLGEVLLPTKVNVWGVAVSQSFLDQFDASIGDEVLIGPVQSIIRARLDRLPDQIGMAGAFGPEVLIHLDAMVDAGRLTPGQIFRSRLIVTFAGETTLASAKADFDAAFPDTNLRLREPEDAVDGLKDLLDTLNNFLAIIGIAALLAGGIGVEQASSAFLKARIGAIAALKSLGADGGLIRTAYTLQLGGLAVSGGLAGLVLGALTPYIMVGFAGDRIALPQALGLYPTPLLTALIMGLLSAGIFAFPAIGRARATPPSALFRNLDEDQKTRTPLLERCLSFACAAALVFVALIQSSRPFVTLALLIGAALSWSVFLLAGLALKWLAGRLSRNAQGFWRLALSNMGGPGSLATVIVPSLGLGITLLSLVVATQTNLLRQIQQTAPANAPSLIFTQVPSQTTAEFDQLVASHGVDISNGNDFRRAPFLLVRVTSIKGTPVADAPVSEAERWVVRGETSVTFLGPQPQDTRLTAGEWWSEDYSGPLLVSVEEGAAKGLRLSPGDELGIRVFGRDLTATVASIRQVEWGTFGIGSNTAFVFSPGTLEAANPSHVAIARTEGSNDRALIADLATDFPDVLVFETRPALEAASKIFEDISLAVNAAASVVTISALLVLIGTFGVMARTRAWETALLKSLGAERGQILKLYALEFALAGGAGALLGVTLGTLGAYPIIVQVFEAKWMLPALPVSAILLMALFVAAVGGLAVGRSTLARPTARVLRQSDL